MAGIAGILKKGEKSLVMSMLETISHRGSHGKAVFAYDDATIGMIWAEHEEERVLKDQRKGIFSDGRHAAGVSVTRPTSFPLNVHWISNQSINPTKCQWP